MEEGYLTVAEVGRLTGATRKALRHYEQVGLVRPARRTEAGYRLYDQEALRRIHLVNRAKLLGLSLAEADDFIHVADGCCAEDHPELATMVAAKLVETERRIGELRSLEETLRGVLDRLAREEGEHRCDETLCTCNQLLTIQKKADVRPALGCAG
ncbi:MAG TPA: MerR family transcriptional regulator [Acidimicrobiales bacterium]|nr:MerR family transcriptional regulator [Acidimicrobiales bacterium]